VVVRAQDRVVVLRFGHDYEETCMQMDEVRAALPPRPRRAALLARCVTSPAVVALGFARATRLVALPSRARFRATQTLASIAEPVKNFAVIYVVDITEVRACGCAARGCARGCERGAQLGCAREAAAACTRCVSALHAPFAWHCALRVRKRTPHACLPRCAPQSVALTRTPTARRRSFAHQVPDFNTMYELFDPCTIMFFFRNKARPPTRAAPPPRTHTRVCASLGLLTRCVPVSCVRLAPPYTRPQHIMIDLGTGNNNKINWAFNEKQELIDIIETVYRGGRKGRGLVVSPKDYSTKYRY
jgi:hypothetical protein